MEEKKKDLRKKWTTRTLSKHRTSLRTFSLLLIVLVLFSLLSCSLYSFADVADYDATLLEWGVTPQWDVNLLQITPSEYVNIDGVMHAVAGEKTVTTSLPVYMVDEGSGGVTTTISNKMPLIGYEYDITFSSYDKSDMTAVYNIAASTGRYTLFGKDFVAKPSLSAWDRLEVLNETAWLYVNGFTVHYFLDYSYYVNGVLYNDTLGESTYRDSASTSKYIFLVPPSLRFWDEYIIVNQLVIDFEIDYADGYVGNIGGSDVEFYYSFYGNAYADPDSYFDSYIRNQELPEIQENYFSRFINAVTRALQVEIFPGFQISMLLSMIVGISLLIWFLKLMAGG